MAKWYTPEADIVVGQSFLNGYDIDEKSGVIIPEYIVLFGKDGLDSDGTYSYSPEYKALDWKKK